MASYVPSVDYTSRDYSAILSDMTSLIPNFTSNWTNRDPADFGMVLLELFAYMGDLLSYYIDRAANEAMITTATQRQSLLDISTMLGYVPTLATPATALVTFTNTSASAITVPALTQVATSLIANSTTSQVVYEVTSAVTVPAQVGSTAGTVRTSVTQGVTVSNESVGVSNGYPSQVYQLANTSVINKSTIVVINGVTYAQVPYLVDYGSYDPVYSTYVDENNITYVKFGDGVSGRIPPNGATIYVTYRVGGGVLGNVATGLIKYILTMPGFNAIPTGLSAVNSDVTAGDGAATGGADAESNDSIRYNTPLSIRSINRAVAVNDYAYLATQVLNVAKAVAYASVYSSITIYMLPSGDPGVSSDNVTPSATFNTVSANVLSYLVNKAPGNTTITVQPPKWVGAYINLNITVNPTYSQSAVKTAVTTAINNLFFVDNTYFNQTISVSSLYNAVAAVPGVAYQSLTKMVRTDADQTYVVNNKQLVSSVATLTTSTTHTLTVGQTVSVTNVDATFNGTYVVTAVTSNTFSYALIASPVSSTPVSGGAVTALTVKDIVCAVSEIPMISYSSTFTLGSLNITATGGVTS